MGEEAQGPDLEDGVGVFDPQVVEPEAAGGMEFEFCPVIDAGGRKVDFAKMCMVVSLGGWRNGLRRT